MPFRHSGIALERGDVETRSYATYALASISKPYPEELLPALDTLLDRVEDENQTIRTNALSTVGHIVSGYPNGAVEFADSSAALLESDEKRTRNNAAGLLGDIAQERPDVVIDYADELAVRLADPNIQARINASIALLRVGEADPDAIRAQHIGSSRRWTMPAPKSERTSVPSLRTPKRRCLSKSCVNYGRTISMR